MSECDSTVVVPLQQAENDSQDGASNAQDGSIILGALNAGIKSMIVENLSDTASAMSVNINSVDNNQLANLPLSG
ncbi:unnamed protein product [Adineta ricciae]|uniref:Uncharacterized protein n=1 Tax=Adineta ricciae TaxID=249248 RepID=A0A814Q392_ADIRI|nr:unnamed protein product [Adineta ricciae]CAF1318856.1 unnamed protein product [Adineta ricciae]